MKEVSHMSMSAKKTDNSESTGNEELVKRKPIDGTPFEAIWKEEIGWFGTIGKYKVTEYYETEDELRKEVQEKSWNLILNVMTIIAMETRTDKIVK